VIRSKAPNLTVTLNDLYPRSDTYVQVYQGSPALNTTGSQVPGSVLVWNDSKSKSTVIPLSDYDSVFTKDGTYTMELLTVTPFGTDRLSYVTFTVNRNIEVRGLLGGSAAEVQVIQELITPAMTGQGGAANRHAIVRQHEVATDQAHQRGNHSRNTSGVIRDGSELRKVVGAERNSRTVVLNPGKLGDVVDVDQAV
jgi:hypothetical protein